MVVINLRLSGFPNNDPVGHIEVSSFVLTTEAYSWITGGVLSWAGVRHLDMLMKRRIWLETGGSNYIAGLKRSSGRHLFSLLACRKLLEHDPDFSIIGNEQSKPTLKIRVSNNNPDAMSFPNSSSSNSASYPQLWGIQHDSRYRFFCEDETEEYLWLRNPTPRQLNIFHPRLIPSFIELLAKDATLEKQDKIDILAYFTLRTWAARFTPGGIPGAPVYTGPMQIWNMSGATSSMPDPTGPVPLAARQNWKTGQWIDYIWSNHRGLANFVGLSSDYGARAFPLGY